jgi:hypothetical protein
MCFSTPASWPIRVCVICCLVWRNGHDCFCHSKVLQPHIAGLAQIDGRFTKAQRNSRSPSGMLPQRTTRPHLSEHHHLQ